MALQLAWRTDRVARQCFTKVHAHQILDRFIFDPTRAQQPNRILKAANDRRLKSNATGAAIKDYPNIIAKTTFNMFCSGGAELA